MTIVVTGGAGFIGSHLVETLVAQTDAVSSIDDPNHDADVNVLGTVRVLEAAREVGARVVFASSGGAICREISRPAREDDPPRPVTPYGVSKLCAEQYIHAWNRIYGADHVILRFSNVYGPRQQSSLEGGVVAIFLTQIARQAESTIYGDGSQTRDFIYVGDAVSALLEAGDRDLSAGGVYNVGTGVETSIRSLYEVCCDTANVDRASRSAEARPGECQRSAVDPSRLSSATGWRPRMELADGIRMTWESLG